MKKYFVLMMLISTLFMSCKKDLEKPTVGTLDVTDVTATTAMCGGSITSNGGAEITAKGVCWATTQNPTINDNCANAKASREPAIEIYTCEINNLEPNTTYYVRAYATNEVGISYGEEKTFTTLEADNGDEGDENGDDEGNNDENEEDDENGDDEGDDDNEEVIVVMPTVVTSMVTDITETSAICGGNVESDGGAEVTERGVCWSISSNPTIDDNKMSNGGGIGDFTSQLNNLESQTTYYVRAYATNEAGTSYGEEKSFTTLEKIVEEEETINGYKYVDLGLPSGLKWATVNVGATEQNEVGSYFAWGEIKSKEEFYSDNSVTYGLQIGDFSGDPEYDVAAASWGSTWRMPTESEVMELRDNCTLEWTYIGSTPGCLLTGPNGNQIFMPSGGFITNSSVDFAESEAAYWTSTPDVYNGDTGYATFVYFYNNNFCNRGWMSRYVGMLVRPVSD